MVRSKLDPCVFYWHHENSLGGVICLHVDDIVVGLGGCEEFHVQVLDRLNKRYPFKHWQTGSGMS
jgi:hypothetical protein